MNHQNASSMNRSYLESGYACVPYSEPKRGPRSVHIVLLQQGSHVTEAHLARQVLEEFFHMRNGLADEVLTVSVSSVRLQNLMMQRYPNEYRRLVLCGVWNGKWHRFLEEAVGLRCFLYAPEDFEAVPSLEAHVPASELRCCLIDEDHWAVRCADGQLGEALRMSLLDRHYLQIRCEALATSMCDRQVERSKPRWWTPRAPWLAALLKRLANAKGGGRESAVSVSLRRGAVSELTTMLVEKETLAKHISTKQLRTCVARCVASWDRTTFVPNLNKCIFTIASG